MTKKKPKSQLQKVGRKTKMSEVKVKKLEEAFALDCTVNEACFYAEISKTTYYNWLEEKPELVDRFDALKNKPIFLARKAVVSAISTDPDLALKYLSKKKKDEFSDRTEMTGADGNPLLSLKELYARAKKQQK